MASNQIEYCGNCEHYEHCIKLAESGRLNKCKIAEQGKQGEQAMKETIKEIMNSIMFLALFFSIAWICCMCSGYHFE